MFEFEILKQSNQARRGVLKTSRGVIQTPTFMPVGTVGSVKAVGVDDLSKMNAEIILGNTYHLHLRPGEEVIEKMGGLANFNSWKRPTLTDSGGFQVFSLGDKTVMTEEGVEFVSHVDGSKRFLSPEISIKIQRAIGADIVMAFDECTPSTDYAYTKSAMERTHRWLVRSKNEWERDRGDQTLFGIIQGGDYRDLREESARFVASQELGGIAIGGESIGYLMEKTIEQIGWVKELVNEKVPFYAMGVGLSPEDLVRIVKAGVDMCDCVAPTRLARNGALYQGRVAGEGLENARFESEFARGRIQISNSKWRYDKNPIQEDCDCATCQQGYSRGYLRHLFLSKELVYYRLASVHNLRVMIRTMEQMRAKIC